MTFTPFDLAMYQPPLNFKLGPSKVCIPEPLRESDKYFSIAQLHVMFTDLRNMIACSGRMADVSLVIDDQREGGVSDQEELLSPSILSPLNMKPLDADAIQQEIIEDEELIKDEEEQEDHDERSPLKEELKKTNTGTVDHKQNLALALKHLDQSNVEKIVQRFRYRVKNNHLGHLHYFPIKWNGS